MHTNLSSPFTFVVMGLPLFKEGEDKKLKEKAFF